MLGRITFRELHSISDKVLQERLDLSKILVVYVDNQAKYSIVPYPPPSLPNSPDGRHTV